MAEEIEIIVTAKGFDKVSAGLKNTNEALKSTATEAKKTGDALKTTLNNGSAQAGQSLQNLSRIAQDAPFGFIGIANNINPLIESFGRLKAETGSTGGAFKALLGGLTGPAGIGLAFGVVTAAISFAQIGFDRWGASAKKAKEELDETKKSSEAFAKSIDNARSGALSSGLALQSYVDIAKNGQLPLEQRNEALKKANEILGKHGELLTLTNVATAEVTREVKLYTQALIAQAVAQKYVDKLAELTIEQTNLNNALKVSNLDVANSLDKLNNKVNETAKANKTATYSANSFGSATAQSYTIGAEVIDNYNKSLENQKRIQQKITTTTAQIANLNIDLSKSTLEATAAFGALGTKVSTTAQKAPKAVKNIETLQSAYKSFIDTIVANEKIALTFNEPSTKSNIQAYTSFIETAITKFKASGTFTLPLVVELNALKRSIEVIKPKDLVKSLQEKINLTPIAIPFAIPKGTINNLKKQTVDITSALSAALESSISTIGVSIGEGLAAAINGTANFGTIFQSIFNALGGVVETLGSQIIAIGAAALVAQAAIAQALSNPFLVIAAGVALVALGSLIKSATSQNRFAVGTRNAPGGMALVGERGPEMISLPRGSQVLPAAQTANMLGSNASGLEIYGILRGQDIYFSNKKYSATYARTT